jgi:surface antigen
MDNHFTKIIEYTMKSMIRIQIITTICVMSSMLSMPSAASSWGWAVETPISKLTPEDFVLLKATARDVLNNPADGQKVRWSNPESGHSGTIAVSNTRKVKGQTCRDTIVTIDAVSIKGTSEYLLCAQKDGTWKISS